jgi:hypothetical protein
MALPLRAAPAGGERTREDGMTSGYLPGIFGAGDPATWTRNARNPVRKPEWATVKQEAGISAGSCHADAMAQ